MVKVIWSSKAVSDKKAILEYWSLRNQSTKYSKKLSKLINKKIKQVTENPESGITTELEDIRAVLTEDYYIFYSRNYNHIRILRIWDARQNPETFVP